MTAYSYEQLNQIHPPVETLDPDAAAHVESLRGHLEAPTFAAGWDQQEREGKDFSEDSLYAAYDPESGNGYFAVLDGVGGAERGNVASASGVHALHEFVQQQAGTKFRNSVHGMNLIYANMQQKIADTIIGGQTTAFVGVLHDGYGKDTGKQFFDYGAAGDSLGFIVRADGNIYNLNEEETAEKYFLEEGRKEGKAPQDVQLPKDAGTIIYNGLGTDKKGASVFRGLNERHRVQVRPGDVLVLTSDGITGDNEDQRLVGGDNLAVISAIAMANDKTPREKAMLLIEAATKVDDRTAMVIEIQDQHQHDTRPVQMVRGWEHKIGATALR